MAGTTFYTRVEENWSGRGYGSVPPSTIIGNWNFFLANTIALFADPVNSGGSEKTGGTLTTIPLSHGTNWNIMGAQFVSPPLAAQTIAAQNWTVAYAMNVTSTQTFAQGCDWLGKVGIFLWNGVTGALRSTIFATATPTGSNNNRNFLGETTVWSATCAGSSVVAQTGDLLVCEYGINYNNGSISGTSVCSSSIFTSGATAISSDNVAVNGAQSTLISSNPITFAVTTGTQIVSPMIPVQSTGLGPDSRQLGRRFRMQSALSSHFQPESWDNFSPYRLLRYAPLHIDQLQWIGSRNLFSANTNPTSNVSTGETTLMTYNWPGNTFYNVGDSIVVEAVFTVVNNANTKTLRPYWNNVVLATITFNASQLTQILLRLRIVMLTTTTQSIGLEILGGTTSGANTPFSFQPGSATLTGNVPIKFTGQSSVASGDVTQQWMYVWMETV